MSALPSHQRIDSSIVGKPWGNASYGNQTIATSCDYKVTDSPVGNTANCFAPFTGTAGNITGVAVNSWGFTPAYMANGDICLIIQVQGANAGQWEIKKLVSGLASGTQTLTFDRALQNTYVAGAIIVRAPMVDTLTINSGVTISAPAWQGGVFGVLFMVAKTAININGTITASGKGFRGGRGGDSYHEYGEGINGAAGNATNGNANANAGGSGHGTGYGGGAGGGNAAQGTTTYPAGAGGGGYGGAASGAANLTSMTMGGGGGGGGPSSAAGSGYGSSGGGIIILFSKSITFANGATNSGIQGVGGQRAGGGGAGGSTLLVCETATLGSNTVTALAGAGGVPTQDYSGGAGSVGRIAIYHSGSISGTTNPSYNDNTDTTLTESSGNKAGMMMVGVSW